LREGPKHQCSVLSRRARRPAMAKIIIVKKGNTPTAPQPCPFVVDWPLDARK